MARPISVMEVMEAEGEELERRVKAPSVAKRDSLRAAIILRRPAGIKQVDVAAELRGSVACVNKWSQRFERQGLVGLKDQPRCGRPCSLPAEKVAYVVSHATQPRALRKRHSVRSMAAAAGISRDSVHRIWRANDIKPHLVNVFKVSTDPDFEAKFWDVIGLYLDPPERALVMCCNEKSQCQALERSQLSLPLGPGRKPTQTHDYRRHGTITLFAALNYLDGKVVARTETQHMHVEWLRFLKQIEREMPPDLDLHLIVDNYCTHKEASVQRWLARRPRLHLHFTPTGSSWLNLVERFFGEITADVIRLGSFPSVKLLVRDIEAYLAQRNANPKPYR